MPCWERARAKVYSLAKDGMGGAGQRPVAKLAGWWAAPQHSLCGSVRALGRLGSPLLQVEGLPSVGEIAAKYCN